MMTLGSPGGCPPFALSMAKAESLPLTAVKRYCPAPVPLPSLIDN